MITGNGKKYIKKNSPYGILMVKKKDLEIDREQLFFIVVVNTFYDTFRRVPTGKLWLSKHCFYCAMQTFCSMTRRVWHSKRQ